MKRKIKMLKAFKGAQADTAKGKAMSPGTTAKGDFRGGNNNNDKPSKIGPVVKDVPFKKPFGMKSSIAANILGVGFLTGLGNYGAKQTYKGRQKFSRKEGLYRDFYKTTGNVLQPNSATGKNYLKEAGFNKRKPVIDTGGNNDDPIIPIETTKKIDPLLIKPKENFFNFKAYKVGGLSGGVSYGPAPKRGPNSQVPPVKLKKGSKK